jgi:hypothetical protein
MLIYLFFNSKKILLCRKIENLFEYFNLKHDFLNKFNLLFNKHVLKLLFYFNSLNDFPKDDSLKLI